MSSTDEFIYKQALESDEPDRPFLSKNLVYIQDLNPTSYATNEIIFETASLSSNGRYNDYKNAYITIPLVVACTGLTGVAGATPVNFADADISKADFLLAMRGAYVNLIQSMSIDVGNVNAIQNTAYVNMLLNFNLLSEMSLQEEKLHGPVLGFAKHGNGWRYGTASSGMGRGLVNNLNSNRIPQTSNQYGDFINSGMWDAQQNFISTDPGYPAGTSRSIVFGADAGSANGVLRNSAINHIVNTANSKIYYLVATLRLKDLLFFDKMPSLTKGTFIRIRMTINQCSFQVEKSQAGLLDFKQASMQIGPNGMNPLMIGASVVQLTAMNGPGAVADATPDVVYIAGGSACIPLGGAAAVPTVLNCSLNIVRNTALGLNHPINTCRLYVDSYLLNPAYEASYIERPLRTINFTDVVQYTCSNVPSGGQTFNFQLTQGLKRIKRLVIIPIMNASSHANEPYTTFQGAANTVSPFSPLMSPFTPDGVCCSPYNITNFQVLLGGVNIFMNPMTFTYEQFLSETLNYGLNSGKTTGLCSSRISHQDYIQNHGYIVVDLSRRYNQDLESSLSVQISGTLNGLKNYDLYCYMEYSKSAELDVMNGKFGILGANA